MMMAMIDGLLVRATAGRGGLGSEMYDPTEAVSGSWQQNPDGQDLAVLFPPWHGGRRAYNILSRRLIRQGMAVLRYTFSDDILHHNPQHVSRSFEVIRNEVSADLTDLRQQGRYRNIKLVGVSLGTPALAMVASEFTGFDSATLVTPGARLAHCLWEGRMTQRFRQAYQAKGIRSADELDELWYTIAPIRHVSALAGKAVRLVVTNADQIIPTAYQQEYVTAVQAQPNVVASIDSLNVDHYTCIALFCAKGTVV